MAAARNFQGLANGGARQQLLLSYLTVTAIIVRKLIEKKIFFVKMKHARTQFDYLYNCKTKLFLHFRCLLNYLG